MTTIAFNPHAVVSLPVSNLDKSERWYADTLGFTTTKKLDDPLWCEMKTAVDGLLVGLAEVDKVRVGDALLTLTVDNLFAAREYLLDKKSDVSEIVTVHGIARMVTLLDPDGNALMLREEL